MNIEEYIDQVAEKYNYTDDLKDALKKCIPIMAGEKSDEELKIIIDTLQRVPIIIFDEQPTQEQINELEEKMTNGRNENVKFNQDDLGEYGKKVAPGAYCSFPIFDDEMNIIDRCGYIYLSRLNKRDRIVEEYGTTINLSHLIHEFGHAVASQVGEFVQEENGDYVHNVGTAKLSYHIDKDNHLVESTGEQGLYVEEALNTIDESKTLKDVLNVDDIKNIPGYVPSMYQGQMKAIMERYVEIIGEEPFCEYRMMKKQDSLKEYQDIISSTPAYQIMGTDMYVESKKNIFEERENLDGVSDETKKKMTEFLEEYKDVFFSKKLPDDFLERLNNCFEQIYDFFSIKYKFNIVDMDKETMKPIKNQTNWDIYTKINSAITAEGCVPINQAKEKIENYKSTNFKENEDDGLEI